MTKLKTLNDLVKETGDLVCEDGYHPTTFHNFIHLTNLKAEAVKWVKEGDKEHDEHSFTQEHEYECECMNCHEKTAVRKWIKHFFNLTEDDLK